MRKIIAALLIMVACAMPSFAADWCYIGTAGDGELCFIDNASVVKKDDSVQVWVKYNRSDGGYDLKRLIIYKDRNIAYLSMVTRNSKGKVLSNYSWPEYSAELDKSPIVPESIGEVIYEAVYGKV